MTSEMGGPLERCLNARTIIMQNPWKYINVSKQKKGGRRERERGREGERRKQENRRREGWKKEIDDIL